MREPHIRPDHIAAYVRWSTDDQADGTTLEVQREACRHFILSQGWLFREELLFIDDGCTGANMARPGLSRLRQLCRDGAVDCVVVYKLDRLSRSVVDTVKLVMEEWEGRVHLKSAREAIDTATPTGRQLFYLLVSYAEWERNVIRERTSAGKWRRAQEGRNPGCPPPYGYRLAPGGRFAAEPVEAPVVKRIFAEAAAGRSGLHIAEGLNADRIPSRTGRSWASGTICRLLRNPCYIGVLMYGRTARGSNRRRTKAETPPVQVAGVFPTLVAADTFALVQSQLAGRRPTQLAPRSVSSGQLLTGIAVCARCGQAMTGHVRVGGRYRYYRCAAQSAKGSAFCQCGFVPQAEVDVAVRAKVLHLYAGEESLAQAATICVKAVRTEVARLKAAARQERTRLQTCGEQERRLRRAFLAGEIDARRLDELASLLATQRQEAAAGLCQLEQALATQAQLLARLAAQPAAPTLAQPAALALATRWDQLAPAERKAVLRTFLCGAKLFRDKADGAVTLELAWRVPVAIN